MKTYVTISLNKEDVDKIGNENEELNNRIDDVVATALTLMIGKDKYVQLKITNLPLFRED